MTHTSHPYGFRIGITKDWRAQWFSGKKAQYRDLLREDYLVRNFLNSELKGKMVSEITFERSKESLNILIKTAKPGLIIGREGLGIEELINRVKWFAQKHELNQNVRIRVEEVRHLEKDAMLIAESIAETLRKRMPHRRTMKQTLDKVMANRDIQGCRIVISGRLGGAEIARREEVKRGTIPLQTLRADIDYAHKGVIMPYGVLGVKVWIFKGITPRKK